MRVLVVGATGPTGRLLVDDAIAAGHRVRVFVRDPAKLHRRDVEIVTGDALNGRDVVIAAFGQDAVLSAIGSGNRLLSRVGSRTAEVLVPAYQAGGIRRVVSLTAVGAGPTFRDLSLTQLTYSATGLLPLLIDKTEADRRLRESALDWTLVAAPALTNGPETGRYRVGERMRMRGYEKISRADVARFMVAQLGDPTWLHRIVTITY